MTDQTDIRAGERRSPKPPAGSCDCHIHAFGPPERFKGSADRSYDPREKPLGEYEAIAGTLGLERIVFVQPSAYGTDNSCQLEALRERPGTARAVVVIDASTDRAQLQDMHDLGVRGVRLNLMTPPVSDGAEARARIEQAARQIDGLGWHIQIYADHTVVAAAAPALRDIGVPLVFDHMGGARKDAGPEAPGFQALLSLLADGGCWVKLSGADIVTWENRDFSGATPFARALVEANPARLVWGSDWPHLVHQSSGTGDAAPPAAYRPVDEASLIRFLRDWAGSEETLTRILVTNPAQLYQF